MTDHATPGEPPVPLAELPHAPGEICGTCWRTVAVLHDADHSTGAPAPATPDPLPGSSDPLREFRHEVVDKLSVASHCGRRGGRTHTEIVLKQCEDFLVEQAQELVDAARAADALLHQQVLELKDREIAGLRADIAFKDSLIWTGRESECYKATVAAEKEAKALRAALATAEATIQQQAIEHEATRFKLVAAEQSHEAAGNRVIELAAKLRVAEATITSLTADKVFLDRCWNEACAMAADLRAERDRLHAALTAERLVVLEQAALIATLQQEPHA